MAEKFFINNDMIGTTAENVEYGNGSYLPSNVKDVRAALNNILPRLATLEQNSGSGGGESGILQAQGMWVSLGTSVTWRDTHPYGHDVQTKGYQTFVQQKINFTKYINRGESSALITWGFDQIDELPEEDAQGNPITPDFVTIEFGSNDFGFGAYSWLGTMDDFINRTGAANSNFYRAYRELLDKIYARNPYARIILCTPRKIDGGSNFPGHWYEAKSNGRKLEDYANAILEIGRWMSIPVCDWFNECQSNDDTLALYSYDEHVHPNDAGYKLMASVLIETFKKVI